MKKIFTIILCLCMAFSVHASSPDTYQYTYDNLGITVQFDESSHFSFDERQYLADILAYGNTVSDDSSAYAFCWLTGHDYQYDYVSATHHRVDDIAPRCEKITYEVETCSKCDHLEYTEIGRYFIDCCPEE